MPLYIDTLQFASAMLGNLSSLFLLIDQVSIFLFQAYVNDNTLYHQNNVYAEAKNLTAISDPDYIYNAIPDWLYEGLPTNRIVSHVITFD